MRLLEVVLEEGLKQFSVERVRVGDVLKGDVISVNEKEIAVNVGYRSDGIVPAAELPDETTADYKVGDEVEVMVVSTDDGEGNLLLSVTRAYATLVWDEFEKMTETQEDFVVDVKEVVKGGVVAKYKGARVFIPASMVAVRYVEDLNEFVGQKLTVRMVEFDRAKNSAVASAKVIEEEGLKEKRKALFEELKVGDNIEGTVVRLEPYGAFVNLGGIDGLLHVSNMSWRRVKHPSEIVKVGDKVKVEIIKLEPKEGRISLKLLDAPENPWNDIESKYKVGEVYKGTIMRLQKFGAFIKLEDGVEGLCHVSEISEERVEKPEDVLKTGEEVDVRVLDINAKDQRISLSIRAAKEGAEYTLPSEKPAKAGKGAKQEEAVEGLGIKPTTLADLFGQDLKDKFK